MPSILLYSFLQLFGFFGGTHLAILAALICERNPSASLLDLISMFFKTFAFWPWPEPVILEEGATPKPPPLPLGTQALMPIQLPGSRNEYCHSNMTTSTFNKIRSEFRRGYRQTQVPIKYSQFNEYHKHHRYKTCSFKLSLLYLNLYY